MSKDNGSPASAAEESLNNERLSLEGHINQRFHFLLIAFPAVLAASFLFDCGLHAILLTGSGLVISLALTVLIGRAAAKQRFLKKELETRYPSHPVSTSTKYANENAFGPFKRSAYPLMTWVVPGFICLTLFAILVVQVTLFSSCPAKADGSHNASRCGPENSDFERVKIGYHSAGTPSNSYKSCPHTPTPCCEPRSPMITSVKTPSSPQSDSGQRGIERPRRCGPPSRDTHPSPSSK